MTNAVKIYSCFFHELFSACKTSLQMVRIDKLLFLAIHVDKNVQLTMVRYDLTSILGAGLRASIF